MNRYVPVLQDHAARAPFELDQLVDDAGVLTLRLLDAVYRQFDISFDSCMVYRKMDEGDALLALADMRRLGVAAKWFYMVEDSDFTAWFNEQRCDTRSTGDLLHYCIATSNDIVDVISLNAPAIAGV